MNNCFTTNRSSWQTEIDGNLNWPVTLKAKFALDVGKYNIKSKSYKRIFRFRVTQLLFFVRLLNIGPIFRILLSLLVLLDRIQSAPFHSCYPEISVYLLYRSQIIQTAFFERIVAFWNSRLQTSNTFGNFFPFLHRNLRNFAFLCIPQTSTHYLVFISRAIKPFGVAASKEHLLKLLFSSLPFVGLHLRQGHRFHSSKYKNKSYTYWFFFPNSILSKLYPTAFASASFWYSSNYFWSLILSIATCPLCIEILLFSYCLCFFYSEAYF